MSRLLTTLFLHFLDCFDEGIVFYKTLERIIRHRVWHIFTFDDVGFTLERHLQPLDSACLIVFLTITTGKVVVEERIIRVFRAALRPRRTAGRRPDDATVRAAEMWIAGMQQYKPYFTGAANPPSTRICTVQKCLRTGDIDSVGDYSHCTLFEMLGNFSFGDYFKRDAIRFAWTLITEVYGLPKDKLFLLAAILRWQPGASAQFLPLVDQNE